MASEIKYSNIEVCSLRLLTPQSDSRVDETIRSDSTNSQGKQLRRFELYKLYNFKRDRVRPFINNVIHTSKYTFITFLPKNLYYQFRKMSNLYFLAMSLLEVSLFVFKMDTAHSRDL
jgi:hypothetical protein